MISTAVSHPNKAIVIYWGNSDDRINLPSRTSLSMTLQGIDRALDYTATLQTSPGLERDRVIVGGREDKGEIYSYITRHLDAMRDLTHFKEKITVSALSTFPVGSGLAGSAAAASAIAEAFAGLLDRELDKREISVMARRGSGSAARSVFGGFVRLDAGSSDSLAAASRVRDESHWDLRDVIAVVDPGPKKVKSREGMRLTTRTCKPELYRRFAGAAAGRVAAAEKAIAARDLGLLGQTYEDDNLDFRQVCMNTDPPLDYWTEASSRVFSLVSGFRSDGMQVYSGTDAGPNVHVFCEPKDAPKLIQSLQHLEGVKEVIHARPGGPSRLSTSHLI